MAEEEKEQVVEGIGLKEPGEKGEEKPEEPKGEVVEGIGLKEMADRREEKAKSRLETAGHKPVKKRGKGPFSRFFKMVDPFRLVAMLAKAPYTILFAIGSFIISFIRMLIAPIKPFFMFFGHFFRNVFHKLGTLFPSNIKKKLEDMLLVSGLTQNPEEGLGIVFLYSLTVPAAVFVILRMLLGYGIEISVVVTAISLVGIWLLSYVMLLVIIDRRTTNVEEVLPDMLTMISQNMRAGMTPYNALWAAARPEFGPLALEIQNVARDTLAGISFEKALLGMTERINSPRLERVVSLMIQGMRSGGELPAVLQEIAEDIRNELALVKRMKTETTIQVMFIAFALIFGAPLLFAASNQFVVVFSKTLQEINVPDSAMSGSLIQIHEFPVASSDDCDYHELKCEGKFNFRAYCILALIVSSFFGSLLVGLMRTGKVGSATGLSMVVFMIIASLSVFILLNTLLGVLFGGMMSA